MAALYTNNASTILASGITNSATSLTVQTGNGAKFPNPTSPDYFMCTLQGVSGTPIEIIKVTARSTDTFTIVRAQEGTTASAFNANDIVELRVTAGEMTNLATAGANSNITSLTGLTTALSTAQGGTNVSSAGASGNVLTSNGTNWVSSAQAGLGYGQTWQDVTASRALSTTYTNSTGKPIQVNAWMSVSGSPAGNTDIQLTIGGVVVAVSSIFMGSAAGNRVPFVTGIVPNNTTYSAVSPTGAGTLSWVELR